MNSHVRVIDRHDLEDSEGNIFGHIVYDFLQTKAESLGFDVEWDESIYVRAAYDYTEKTLRAKIKELLSGVTFVVYLSVRLSQVQADFLDGKLNKRLLPK
jgi:hypothetical protein